MRVILIAGCRAHWTTRAEFLAANAFEAAEATEIARTLLAGRVYRGGGGAGLEWALGTPAAICRALPDLGRDAARA